MGGGTHRASAFPVCGMAAYRNMEMSVSGRTRSDTDLNLLLIEAAMQKA